jgi:hypothetical protein
MALGNTNISVSGIKTEMGIGSPNNVSGLNTNAVVNPYSFWSPRGVQFNASTKVLEAVTDAAPYNMGDFRRYNHSAQTPTTRATPNTDLAISPVASGMYVPVWVDYFEVNLKRADASSQIVKVGITYHTTLSDAQNNTSPITLVGGGTVSFHPLSFTNRELRTGVYPDPALAGHVVTQLLAPSSSSVLVSNGSDGANKEFPITGLTTSPVNRWARMNFYSTGDAIVGTFATNIMAFTIRQMAQPVLNTLTKSPLPAGTPNSWTSVYAASVVVTSTIGSGTLAFNFKVEAIGNGLSDTPPKGNNNVPMYVQGTLSIEYEDPYNSGNWVQMSAYQNQSYSKNTAFNVSYAMPNSETWNYDKIINTRILFHTATY